MTEQEKQTIAANMNQAHKAAQSLARRACDGRYELERLEGRPRISTDAERDAANRGDYCLHGRIGYPGFGSCGTVVVELVGFAPQRATCYYDESGGVTSQAVA